MDLLWPGFLLMLGLIPLLIAVYIWMLHRRKRFTVRYSSLSLLREVIPHQSWWRRHLPFALFLLALTSLVVALTRPVSIVSVPADKTTIIMSIDISGSMRSRDIYPTRLAAAESAALSFIQHQKPGTQLGLVAFSSYAELIQPPTSDQEALQAAVESLILGRRTAIGSGLLKALDAIAQADPSVAPSIPDTGGTGIEPTPVPHGAYAPDIIVLLTDGVSNTGPDPLVAAQQAVDRGVRVYTIGFGTQNGSIPFGGQQSQGQDPFGNGGGSGFGGGGGGGGGQNFFGGGFRTGIDEPTLKKIASMTGGRYYTASSAEELQSVFQNLPISLITKHQTTEISVFFTALGALLVLAAVMLSRIWHPFS
jgi:Ca-activated chloride channel homolog